MAAKNVAVLATVMFALLVSSSLVEAARPIVAEGSNVAADGSVMVRDPHSRQLRFFFGHWGFRGCGWWGWWGCGHYRAPYKFDDDKFDDDKRRHSTRKLKTFGWWGKWWGYGYGHGHWWGHWGWNPYWGRK